jgi:hypothetical protein
LSFDAASCMPAFALNFPLHDYRLIVFKATGNKGHPPSGARGRQEGSRDTAIHGTESFNAFSSLAVRSRS